MVFGEKGSCFVRKAINNQLILKHFCQLCINMRRTFPGETIGEMNFDVFPMLKAVDRS